LNFFFCSGNSFPVLPPAKNRNAQKSRHFQVGPFGVRLASKAVGGGDLNKIGDQIGAVSGRLFHNKQFRKWIFSVLAILFVLQVYFVREMLAAEVLFGVVFAIVLLLCGLFYIVGALGERGLDLAEYGVRVAARSARWSFSAVEELSKRQFRHRHSQSAP
jgi:hypothetical protein